MSGRKLLIILGGLLLAVLFGGLYFVWDNFNTTTSDLNAVLDELEIPKGEKFSFVILKEVSYPKTGSEVCYEAGLSCLGMKTTQVFDSTDEFYGYTTVGCDSQVVKQPSCYESFGTEYAIDKVTYTKAASSKSTQFFSSANLCLFSGKGKEGIYEYAYCTKKE